MLSLGKLVASKRGQKIMTRMYGIGAALVIIGALFKLQHWNHAGIMLSVGMITECIIFFFSAFEPLPVEYHWEAVYPELKGDNLNLENGNTAIGKSSRTPLQQSSVNANAIIDNDSAEAIKKSVERFNATANSLNALSTIDEASQKFVTGLQSAATNFNSLSETTKVFANTYNETSQTLASSSRQANENMAVLNKNMQAVNASYELYLQEHQGYVEHSKKLVGTMDNSAQQAQQFDQQLLALNKLIAELNTTYTSLVHTVNTTIKKK